jgi:hypothetical protein
MMFDVFFISYFERYAGANLERLKEFVPKAKHVAGVKGIHAAHEQAAGEATTDHFFTVDADNWILDGFSFDIDFEPIKEAVYVWRCRNPVNYLVYGYGAIKLFDTHHMRSIDRTTVDMTSSANRNYQIVNVVASETRFNTSPFDAWRSAFREACKLASGAIANQSPETAQRLDAWCSHGLCEPFGSWTLDGAREGREYGRLHAGNTEALALINDFTWVKARYYAFCRKHHVDP